jgi:predicted heme/steroid binding protein/uncharacterized membrane protein
MTQKEFTLMELSQFNGEDGKPVYVTYQGKVFDVSNSKPWRGGIHMKRHRAAKDLTTDFKAAPHGEEVLERCPQVGVLTEEPEARKIPKVLESLLAKYPMLRRHPHPMVVHFPIVFMFSTTVMTILFVLTGIRGFETTALHCLVGGTFFTPIAILTGLYSWWLNYLAKPLKPVTIKQWFSLILFALQITLLAWRIKVPHILYSFSPGSAIYFLLTLALLPIVIVIGWHGAKLTFPIER